MKKRTRRILLLTIIIAIVSPLSFYFSVMIAAPTLMTLLFDYDEFCQEVRDHA